MIGTATATTETELKPAKPFVKWVGGKTQLLPELLSRVPDAFGWYYEPFLGGGALYWALANTRHFKATLSDANSQLINTYRIIRKSPEALLKSLSCHGNAEELYYMVRKRDRDNKFAYMPKVEQASRFIYLNKTCYNGLYRVNQKGQFNVPFGHRKTANIADRATIESCSELLNRDPRTSFQCCSYPDMLKFARPGSFTYLDPPYIPLTATANFASYTANGFGMDAQIALRDYCRELGQRGIKFMLSNSSSPASYELYKEFNVETVYARRNINSNAAKRSKVPEILVRNYA